MSNGHTAAVLLFTGALVCFLGSHSYQVSLTNTDLLSPVADEPLIYDWQSLDKRLKTIPAVVPPVQERSRTSIKPVREVSSRRESHTAPRAVHVVQSDAGGGTPLSHRGRMESYVEEKFGQHADRAKKIIQCESSWNEKAVNNSNRNGSNDKGLWQINSIHKISDACRLDYRCATDFARKLFDRQGFNPWVCHRKLT